MSVQGPVDAFSPREWLRSGPRLLLLAGPVLAFFTLLCPWVVTRMSNGDSAPFTMVTHGLDWTIVGDSSQQISAELWNARLVLTVAVLLGMVILGSVALVRDRRLASWWDTATLVGSWLLILLTIAGVVQTLQITHRPRDVSEQVRIVTRAGLGLWLFVAAALITWVAALWQYRRSHGMDARPAVPGWHPAD